MSRLIGLCFVLIFASQSLAQSEKPDTKWLTLRIRIVDEQGNPVTGAEAKFWLFNEKFSLSLDGLKQGATSNQEGLCDLPYPELSGFTIESATASITHPDFCTARPVVPVDAKADKPFEVKLKRGIKLTVSAVDEQGEPTKTPFGILISGSGSPSLWNRPEPQLAICSSLTSGNRQIMLVQQTDDGRRLFSDVLTQQFNQEKEPEVRLDDIELRPGISIKGKLDSKVPRPVKNGFVGACQAPLPAGDAWDEALPSVMYHDWVEVQEDGSFEFPSMPDLGTIQLIGVCDGWVGVQEGSRVVGEQFEVESDLLELTLAMQPTFDVKFKVLDKEGKPVAGATAICSPNQVWFKGGSTILGARFRSAELLTSELKSKSSSKKTDSSEAGTHNIQNSVEKFRAVSDQDGNMTLSNLPREPGGQQIMIFHENGASLEKDVELPAEGENQVDVEVVLDMNSDSKGDK